MQASATRALCSRRSAAALALSAWGRLRMGRPELPQERVQLGRAPLAAASHTVAAFALPRVVVVVCGVPVEALTALLLREDGVDPAHDLLR